MEIRTPGTPGNPTPTPYVKVGDHTIWVSIGTQDQCVDLGTLRDSAQHLIEDLAGRIESTLNMHREIDGLDGKRVCEECYDWTYARPDYYPCATVTALTTFTHKPVQS